MRQAGMLAPLFSLPGRFGIGNLGRVSFDFMDRLNSAGITVWQLLPLNPVGFGHSPYQPYSSWAGESLYLDPDQLYEDGLLRERPESFRENSERVDYEAVRGYLEPLFREAYGTFMRDGAPEEFRRFVAEEEWVKPYGVFIALKRKNGGRSWPEWPEADRNSAECLKEIPEELYREAEYEWFLQYEFFRQWERLRARAREKGIALMGDIPFYAGLDSQDVWAEPEEFLLDPNGYPTHVAGVPPDYFSADGQRWGNPVYSWDRMRENRFSFWERRLKGAAKLFDIIRIDHFRAFDTYWKIPVSCPTAREGEWCTAPGYELFDTLLPLLPGVTVVAEDLGMLRPEVYTLRDHYDFPGMNVLQFTFFDPGFSFRANMVTYTGTHDNETIVGWYHGLSARARKIVRHRLRVSERASDRDIARGFIRFVMRKDCRFRIIPVWDAEARGNEARINTPGIVSNDNWTWKMSGFGRLDEGLRDSAPYFRG